MKRRIAVWSLAGSLVACAWVLALRSMAPPLPPRSSWFWIVVDITAPASLLRSFAMKYYWFVLLNAVAYAVVGLGAELLRHSPGRRSSG